MNARLRNFIPESCRKVTFRSFHSGTLMSYCSSTSFLLQRPINFGHFTRNIVKACVVYTVDLRQPRTPIHHRPKHGTFRPNVFGTCAFRGITPSLLKSPIRKARNEFQLPALANIRSTSSTHDATDSKSRRFLETSGESYPRSLWLWHLVISRSAVSFLLCSMKIARRRVSGRKRVRARARARERERETDRQTDSAGKNKGGEGKSREMKAVKKTRSRGDLFSRQKKVGKIARGSRRNGATRTRRRAILRGRIHSGRNEGGGGRESGRFNRASVAL